MYIVESLIEGHVISKCRDNDSAKHILIETGLRPIKYLAGLWCKVLKEKYAVVILQLKLRWVRSVLVQPVWTNLIKFC